VVQAKVNKRLPVVLTPREVRALFDELNGTMGLIVSLLYGTGMRLLEGLRLRVKDVEFERREILVRDGKGGKDRVTMLPENLMLPLQDQLARARRLHDANLADGFGEVWLPDALAVKYPNAGKHWGWQYVFPSPNRTTDPRSGAVRGHHVLPESVQKAVKGAAGSARFIIGLIGGLKPTLHATSLFTGPPAPSGSTTPHKGAAGSWCEQAPPPPFCS
jgi:integrase